MNFNKSDYFKSPLGISVIICTYNGGYRLQPTLEALALQNIDKFENIEILLIDNASSDNTVELALKYWDKLSSPIPLKIIPEPRSGKANALNTGYNEAKYELMLLCDDDNWLQPDYFTIILDIFQKHPEIALAGGYGIAEFGNEEKPPWFDQWQNNYACGKLHEKSCFLKFGDFRIWGAGSVLRKSMWIYLLENGFQFVNSTKAGKPLGEDAEISHAVMYSGHKLYFDERLWFYHDLSGGRISWENYLEQMMLNGKISACFTVFYIAYKHESTNRLIYFIHLYILIIRHTLGFIFQSLKLNNKSMRITRYEFLKVLVFNNKRNYSLFLSSHIWINKLKKLKKQSLI
jgi:glycosyltransferase involved in cell wall biosynthesis